MMEMVSRGEFTGAKQLENEASPKSGLPLLQSGWANAGQIPDKKRERSALVVETIQLTALQLVNCYGWDVVVCVKPPGRLLKMMTSKHCHDLVGPDHCFIAKHFGPAVAAFRVKNRTAVVEEKFKKQPVKLQNKFLKVSCALFATNHTSCTACCVHN